MQHRCFAEVALATFSEKCLNIMDLPSTYLSSATLLRHSVCYNRAQAHSGCNQMLQI